MSLPQNQPDVETFKKMCRLLELKRRLFLAEEWKHYSDLLPRPQFYHLMDIRYVLPCNLGKIMEITGLTSAGASLFVEKLVQRGFFCRVDDPADRRNVKISTTTNGQKLLQTIESRLNEYICHYFDTCRPEELDSVNQAVHVVCGIIVRSDEEEEQSSS